MELKYVSLILLVVQNTVLVLLMRYSRTVEGPMYATSTAVCMNEVVKVATCFGVIYLTSGGWKPFIRTINVELISKPAELLKLAVPSLLYTVQNNLLYAALSNLDSATYSVCYQLKILTTAVFSVLMLGKQISRIQWASLCLLTVGVALSEFSNHLHAHAGPSTTEKQNELLGFFCVLLAACTSGFAGVYFEMILKGAKTSLWIRNVQMGVPSVFLSLVSAYTVDVVQVRGKGFFHGFSAIVWGVVLIQALGGLVVAVVVKYADNILKAFASAISIITSCLFTIVIFGFRPNFMFIIGSIMVAGSVFMYGKPPKKAVKTAPAKQVLPLFDMNIRRDIRS